MQALERLAPKKPSRPGQIERVEFEYKRHGTLCLIASFMVATGRVEVATIGPTRTEKDFAAHVERTIDRDPNAVLAKPYKWTYTGRPLKAVGR